MRGGVGVRRRKPSFRPREGKRWSRTSNFSDENWSNVIKVSVPVRGKGGLGRAGICTTGVVIATTVSVPVRGKGGLGPRLDMGRCFGYLVFPSP